MAVSPYEELPYRSVPIEWTAPERLALASRLHGGPSPALPGCRVLELGCADGANLIPMAWFRPHARFTGIDNTPGRIELARERARALGLDHLDFLCADIRDAAPMLEGRFDFIIAHGVCSWIAPEALQDLLALCARRLAPGGLLYLNYNALPGWHIRGMVRDLLREATQGIEGLRDRAQAARDKAGLLASAMAETATPYAALLANEFAFVQGSELSYVAHEFLCEENHAFWHSDFMAMAARHGLRYVADADFNYATGRSDDTLIPRLVATGLGGRHPRDTADFLCHRQLHSPILAHADAAAASSPPDLRELWIAACLTPTHPQGPKPGWLVHPSGYEVEVKDASVGRALAGLRDTWPRGQRIGALFDDVAYVADDLLALHRNGLVDLRLAEPASMPTDALHALERAIHDDGAVTNAYHMRVQDMHAAQDAQEGTAPCGP